MIDKGDKLEDLKPGPVQWVPDPPSAPVVLVADLPLSGKLRALVALGRGFYSAERTQELERLADEAERLEERLAARAPCAACGDQHHRGGDYCSDRCRARHYRDHAPPGTIRSSRSLASGGWSLVVHLPRDEADRGSKFRVKARVYIQTEEDPNP